MNGNKRTITFEGVELSVPSTVKMGLLAHAKLAPTVEDMWKYCEAILGPEEMAKVADLDLPLEGGAEGVISYLTKLLIMVDQATGIAPGESSASVNS